MTNCNVTEACNVRVLHVLPFSGNGGDNGRHLREAFNSGARDPADADFWLVGTSAGGDEGREEVSRYSGPPLY